MDIDNLKHVMDAVIAKHGYAAPTEVLAALVGWQARFYAPAHQNELADAAEMLTKASRIIERLEKECPIP